MSTDEHEATQQYKVVINDEEQRSIWPADEACPPGWREEGARGTRAACLEHIERTWTDMRPLSLRRRIEAAAR
ncbi:MAG: MbtH family NRPS accessory protein [Polyangiaceae bacterium]|nr:MbtH family NRPS accessory protein [Polyangiaceae bacterium]